MDHRGAAQLQNLPGFIHRWATTTLAPACRGSSPHPSSLSLNETLEFLRGIRISLEGAYRRAGPHWGRNIQRACQFYCRGQPRRIRYFFISSLVCSISVYLGRPWGQRFHSRSYFCVPSYLFSIWISWMRWRTCARRWNRAFLLVWRGWGWSRWVWRCSGPRGSACCWWWEWLFGWPATFNIINIQ